MIGFNGGLIGKNRTTSLAAAEGVWTPGEQIRAQRSGLWPVVGVSDPDAISYIAAVEAADGNTLELGVKTAINVFIVGCKFDGIWSAIKASCILAGARTLAGALTPLVGSAPTNNGPFVSGDYNRETGLAGNGSSKYLSSNRANNADPQNSNHNAVWLTTYTSGDQYVMGSGAGSGDNFLLARPSAAFYRNRLNAGSPGTESVAATGSEFSGGLFGMSRTSSSNVNVSYRQNTGQVFSSIASNSVTPSASTLDIFRQSTTYSGSRLAFYSIGELLNLSLLHPRVSTLISDIAAAIP